MSFPEVIMFKYYLLYCIYLMCLGRKNYHNVNKQLVSKSTNTFQDGAYCLAETSCVVKSLLGIVLGSRVGNEQI